MRLDNNVQEYGYKYVSLDTLEKILEKNTLIFNSPLIFNDLFDSDLSNLDYSNLTDERAEEYRKMMMAPNFLNGKYLNRLKDVENDKSKIIEIIKEADKQYIENAGITCFSKSPNINLMWAHYGDQHKGACIRFNLRKLILNIDQKSKSILGNVKYESEGKKLDITKGHLSSLFNTVFTKYIDWQYEEEIRLFIPKVNGLIQFNKEAITEVILGNRVMEFYFYEKLMFIFMHNEYNFIEYNKVQKNYKDGKLPLDAFRFFAKVS